MKGMLEHFVELIYCRLIVTTTQALIEVREENLEVLCHRSHLTTHQNLTHCEPLNHIKNLLILM